MSGVSVKTAGYDWRPVTIAEALELDKNSSLFRCEACYERMEPAIEAKLGPYFRHVGGDGTCRPARAKAEREPNKGKSPTSGRI